MTPARLLIINPNSNEAVTRCIADAAAETCASPNLTVDCITLTEAPFGIETAADIDAASALVVKMVEQRNGEHDAFVIACYSDPGLEECRRVSTKPVLGIQESAIGEAVASERPFGVLALSAESIDRHLAYIASRGVTDWHVGERPLDVSVEQGVSDPTTFDKIVVEGRKLIDEQGAEALVLGCAGLGAYRARAEETLGVPVIDPVQSAIAAAVEATNKKVANSAQKSA